MAHLLLILLSLWSPAMGHARLAVIAVITAPADADGDSERDQRTESEWHLAVVSYLKFRAGTPWRSGKSRFRNAPRYLEYLDAIRLVESVRYLPKFKPEPVLPALAREMASARVPWIKRPWDHFTRCRCASCRSLRMRGTEPASARPRSEQEKSA